MHCRDDLPRIAPSLPLPPPSCSPPSPLHTQTVCTYWLRGLCMKGDQCGFLHQFVSERMPVCRNLLKYGECTDQVGGLGEVLGRALGTARLWLPATWVAWSPQAHRQETCAPLAATYCYLVLGLNGAPTATYRFAWLGGCVWGGGTGCILLDWGEAPRLGLTLF